MTDREKIMRTADRNAWVIEPQDDGLRMRKGRRVVTAKISAAGGLVAFTGTDGGPGRGGIQGIVRALGSLR